MENLLSKLICNSLTEVASSRTRKYFINVGGSNVPDQTSKDFKERVDKLVNTILYLATLKESSFVLNDRIIDASKYMVPTHFNQLIRLGRVYINEEARNAGEPLFQLDNIKSEILDDREFNKFFDDYNEYQNVKLELTNVQIIGDGVLLSDLASAKTEDGHTVKIGGSVISGEAAAIMGVTIPISYKYFKGLPGFSERELVVWLM